VNKTRAPADGWDTAALGEIAEVTMGQSPPSATFNVAGEGLPFFQGVRDFNYRHPTARVFCSAPKRTAFPGDILLSVRAPIGRVNVADRECATGRGIAIVRARAPADGRFLEYVLRELEPSWVSLETSGSVFGNATRRDIESLTLAWPRKQSARAGIARVLGALDDKIELNRRMSETLDEMARALFRAWFVDFNPVRAKTEGRPSGLPPDLDALFPASFEESELGEIPAGWGVEDVYAVAEVIHGAPFSSKLFNEDRQGLPLIRIRDLRSGAPRVFTDEILPGARIVQPGRILVGMDGEFRAYLWRGTPAYMNQRVCEFVERPPVSRAFLLYGLEDLLREQELTKSATTVIHLLKRDIDEFRLVAPPAALHEYFRAQTDPLLALRVTMSEDSRSLGALRDALLPHLLSGELRVRVRT